MAASAINPAQVHPMFRKLFMIRPFQKEIPSESIFWPRLDPAETPAVSIIYVYVVYLISSNCKECKNRSGNLHHRGLWAPRGTPVPPRLSPVTPGDPR